MKQALESGFKKLNGTPQELEMELGKVEEMLQQITAAANFARMEISHHLAEHLTLVIEAITSHEVDPASQASELEATCITALDVLWELHRFIAVSGNESEFWHNDVSKNNFIKVFESLENFLGGKG